MTTTTTKGERIRQLREAKGLTQEMLAAKLNIAKQSIGKYEKNIVTNIPSDRIEALAVALDSTPEYIMGWETIAKKNDIISDAVVNMRKDEDYLDIVAALNSMDTTKRRAIKTLLSPFLENPNDEV